jgi:hypothetical protein
LAWQGAPRFPISVDTIKIGTFFIVFRHFLYFVDSSALKMMKVTFYYLHDYMVICEGGVHLCTINNFSGGKSWLHLVVAEAFDI